MAWITRDDFIELRAKIRQRGLHYILTKVNPSSADRVRSTFGASSATHANWWIIPAIRARWNQRITGEARQPYEEYVIERYLSGAQHLRMLSLGCGVGSHERAFAKKGPFSEVIGIDLAPNLIEQANAMARQEELTNIRFITADVNTLKLSGPRYDVLLFHSSLHHFLQLGHLMETTIPALLKPGGFLVLNDYWGPNRLQWTRAQLATINRLLPQLPRRYRQRFLSKSIKNRVHGPGYWRMKLSDPSEAAEAERIYPLLRKHYQTLEESTVGGNILMPLFKDIAHNFLEEDEETRQWLTWLFRAEDEFLARTSERSLLFFGVYQPNVTRPE